MVYSKMDEKDKHWQYMGKSEVVYNDLNPDFNKVFKINYYFEKSQILRIDVNEWDDDGEHETIGWLETPLNRLLTAPKQTLKDDLKFNQPSDAQEIVRNRGRIIIRADSVQDSNHEMNAIVKCTLNTKRRKKFTFGCFYGYPDNPIIIVERTMDPEETSSVEFLKVYLSEVHTETTQVDFKKIAIKLQRLCGGK